MKVLFLINGLGTGGAERSLAEMLPALVDAGIRPVVACLYRRAEGVEAEVVAAGFDVRFVEGRRLLSRIGPLRRLIREERPALVHSTIFDANVVGRLAAAGSGVPVLSSLVNVTYGPERLRDPNIRASRLAAVRLIDGWTARHLTAHFHAITHAVKRSAVAALRLDPDRISVIERGRDPARLGRPGSTRRREARRRLGLEDDHEVVLSVGRQEYQKGQRYLLEAVGRLAPQRPRLVALVAGRQGQASAELDRLRDRPGLRERVRFLGHRRDVPDILAAADVFALPSLFEGLGGVLIEAMALEVPIVASDLPAVREVVEGRAAMLASPAAPGDLASAIARLLDDRAVARDVGRAGREIFERRFTLERSAVRMIELYRRLAVSRSDRGLEDPVA
jgi:glycosyltransferase involved in cell wall biosynthesis